MALKSVDDVEVGGFDDELFAIEIAYLAKNFRNFLKNSNRRAKVRTLLNLETLGRMIPLRLTTMKNLEKKLVNLQIIPWVLSVLDVKGMAT